MFFNKFFNLQLRHNSPVTMVKESILYLNTCMEGFRISRDPLIYVRSGNVLNYRS